MNIQNLKQCLREEMELNKELVDLIKEMLIELFPDDKTMVVHDFETDLDYMHYNGCLSSLQFYKNQYQKRLDYRNKCKAENGETK